MNKFLSIMFAAMLLTVAFLPAAASPPGTRLLLGDSKRFVLVTQRQSQADQRAGCQSRRLTGSLHCILRLSAKASFPRMHPPKETVKVTAKRLALCARLPTAG